MNLNELPAEPASQIHAQELGRFIPRVIVMSPDYKQIIGLVLYEAVKKDGDRAFRDIKKSISNYRKAS